MVERDSIPVFVLCNLHYFQLLLFHLTYLQLYILNAEEFSPITSKEEESKMAFPLPKHPTSKPQIM